MSENRYKEGYHNGLPVIIKDDKYPVDDFVIEMNELDYSIERYKEENEQLQATNKQLLEALEEVKYELQANENMDSASLFSRCVEAFYVAEKAVTNAKQMGDSDG